MKPIKLGRLAKSVQLYAVGMAMAAILYQASAQEYRIIALRGNQILEINNTNGAFTVMFDLPFLPDGWDSMDYNPADKSVYVAHPEGGGTVGFYRLDLIAGTATRSKGVNVESFAGIGFLPSGNVFGYHEAAGFTTGTLYFINWATGGAQSIGSSGTPSMLGGNYDPMRNVFWASDEWTGKVYQLSVTNAAVLWTSASTWFVGNGPGDLKAIDVAPNGDVIIGATDDASSVYRLLKLDVPTGFWTNWLAISETGIKGFALVPVPPAITRHPTNVIANMGDSVGFSVTVTGTPNLSFQWLKDGVAFPGGTNSTLTITNLQPARIGNYTVTITNIAGEITSSVAVLSIPGFNSALWQGLVAQWKLEGDAEDVLGISPGIAQNIQWQSGLPGNRQRAVAYLGGGPVGGVNVQKTPALNLPATGYSIMGWVMSSNYTSTPPPNTYFTLIASQGTSDPQQEDAFILRYGPQGLNLQVSALDNYPGTDLGSRNIKFVKSSDLNGDVLQPGKWHWICATYDGNSFTGYVDGKPLNAIGNTNLNLTAPKQTQRNTGIGMRADGFVGVYDPANNGFLSDVRIYNRALSKTEVEQFYANESPVPAITSHPTNQAVLAGRNASFTVAGSGPGPLTYQWLKNGTNALPSGTNSSLVIVSAQVTDLGGYSAVVSGVGGSITSRVAELFIIRPAIIQPTVINGFVVGGVVVDGGYGYTNTPAIVFQGGSGTGATGTVVMVNGVVVAVNMVATGGGYAGESPAVLVESPIPNLARLLLSKAVKPVFHELLPGASYQLQLSEDLVIWRNAGTPFTATNTTMSYPQYWDVDNWNKLNFRLLSYP